jgi:hypothetical protein
VEKRRRVLLVLGLVLAATVTLLFWVARSKNNGEVALVFVGFTNQLLTGTVYGTGQSWVSVDPVSVPAALLLATNKGSVAVTLWAAVRPESLAAPDFVLPPSVASSPVLKPGDSVILPVGLHPDKDVWWTELSYRRYGLREKFYDRAWNSGNPIVQGLVGQLYPDFMRAKCARITNPPAVKSWPTMTIPSSGLPIFRPVSETVSPFLKLVVPRPSVNPTWEDLQRSSRTID